MMRISFVLQAVNRVSAPLAAVNRALRSVRATAASTASAASRAMGTLVSGTTAASRATAVLAQRVRDSGTAAATARGQIGSYIAMARRTVVAGGGRVMSAYDFGRDAIYHARGVIGEEGLARAGRSAAYLRSQVSGLTTGFTLLKYASVAAGIGLGEEFVRGVFKAGGEMQQMLVTLTRLEGGQAKARGSLNWLQTFAMGPGSAFAMPDILKSYQMAVNFGMNPKGGSLTTFADFAAGERKPLQQILFAVKDAMEGTSTRPLANLGIKMKQGKGADGTNSYIWADTPGHTTSTTSAKSPDAVLATVMRIINAKYAGLATAQAHTVPGGIAQIQKLLYLFEAKVAGAGVFDWALTQMNRFFAFVRKVLADGSLDRWAHGISQFMITGGNKLIAFVQSTNWNAVGRDLMVLAVSIGAVARAIGIIAQLGGGGLSGLFNLWLAAKIIGITRALIGFRTIVAVVARTLLALAIGSGPIGWTIIGVTALAGAVYLIYRNWGTLRTWWSKLWADIKAMVPSPSSLLPGWLVRGWGMLTGSGTANAAAPAGRPMAPPLLRKPGAPPAGARGPQGKMVIELQGSGASQAQIKALRATGMQIEVQRGPVRSGG